MMAGKFGKLAPVIDKRTLKLENYLISDRLPAPPSSRAWDKGITSWGEMLNSELGCCVIAAQGHAVQIVTANASTEVTVPDSAILAGYEAVGGYVPGNPQSDQGCDMLTACKWWQGTGIGGHQIAAYATCPLNAAMIQTAIDLFGLAYIGFEVPQSAVDQFNAGQTWTVVPGSPIVGGHCVDLVDYDATGPTCITWGKLQKMTWQFLLTNMDEAYAVVSKEWIEANGQTPSGLNLTQLLADVAAISGNPAPDPNPTPTPTPAPFVPDPTVQADITVIATWANAALVAYNAGKVSVAASDLELLGDYPGNLGNWLAGTVATRPSLPRELLDDLESMFGRGRGAEPPTPPAVPHQ